MYRNSFSKNSSSRSITSEGSSSGAAAGTAAAAAAATPQQDEELHQLLEDIQRVGMPGDGRVTFGELFQDPQVEQYYEALVGTLRMAKKRGLVNFAGQMLLKGPHDNVVISILPSAMSNSMHNGRRVSKTISPTNSEESDQIKQVPSTIDESDETSAKQTHSNAGSDEEFVEEEIVMESDEESTMRSSQQSIGKDEEEVEVVTDDEEEMVIEHTSEHTAEEEEEVGDDEVVMEQSSEHTVEEEEDDDATDDEEMVIEQFTEHTVEEEFGEEELVIEQPSEHTLEEDEVEEVIEQASEHTLEEDEDQQPPLEEKHSTDSSNNNSSNNESKESVMNENVTNFTNDEFYEGDLKGFETDEEENANDDKGRGKFFYRSPKRDPDVKGGKMSFLAAIPSLKRKHSGELSVGGSTSTTPTTIGSRKLSAANTPTSPGKPSVLERAKKAEEAAKLRKAAQKSPPYQPSPPPPPKPIVKDIAPTEDPPTTQQAATDDAASVSSYEGPLKKGKSPSTSMRSLSTADVFRKPSIANSIGGTSTSSSEKVKGVSPLSARSNTGSASLRRLREYSNLRKSISTGNKGFADYSDHTRSQESASVQSKPSSLLSLTISLDSDHDDANRKSVIEEVDDEEDEEEDATMRDDDNDYSSDHAQDDDNNDSQASMQEDTESQMVEDEPVDSSNDKIKEMAKPVDQDKIKETAKDEPVDSDDQNKIEERVKDTVQNKITEMAVDKDAAKSAGESKPATNIDPPDIKTTDSSSKSDKVPILPPPAADIIAAIATDQPENVEMAEPSTKLESIPDDDVVIKPKNETRLKIDEYIEQGNKYKVPRKSSQDDILSRTSNGSRDSSSLGKNSENTAPTGNTTSNSSSQFPLVPKKRTSTWPPTDGKLKPPSNDLKPVQKRSFQASSANKTSKPKMFKDILNKFQGHSSNTQAPPVRENDKGKASDDIERANDQDSKPASPQSQTDVGSDAPPSEQEDDGKPSDEVDAQDAKPASERSQSEAGSDAPPPEQEKSEGKLSDEMDAQGTKPASPQSQTDAGSDAGSDAPPSEQEEDEGKPSDEMDAQDTKPASERSQSEAGSDAPPPEQEKSEGKLSDEMDAQGTKPASPQSQTDAGSDAGSDAPPSKQEEDDEGKPSDEMDAHDPTPASQQLQTDTDGLALPSEQEKVEEKSDHEIEENDRDKETASQHSQNDIESSASLEPEKGEGKSDDEVEEMDDESTSQYLQPDVDGASNESPPDDSADVEARSLSNAEEEDVESADDLGVSTDAETVEYLEDRSVSQRDNKDEEASYEEIIFNQDEGSQSSDGSRDEQQDMDEDEAESVHTRGSDQSDEYDTHSRVENVESIGLPPNVGKEASPRTEDKQQEPDTVQQDPDSEELQSYLGSPNPVNKSPVFVSPGFSRRSSSLRSRSIVSRDGNDDASTASEPTWLPLYKEIGLNQDDENILEASGKIHSEFGDDDSEQMVEEDPREENQRRQSQENQDATQTDTNDDDLLQDLGQEEPAVKQEGPALENEQSLVITTDKNDDAERSHDADGVPRNISVSDFSNDKLELHDSMSTFDKTYEFGDDKVDDVPPMLAGDEGDSKSSESQNSWMPPSDEEAADQEEVDRLRKTESSWSNNMDRVTRIDFTGFIRRDSKKFKWMPPGEAELAEIEEAYYKDLSNNHPEHHNSGQEMLPNSGALIVRDAPDQSTEVSDESPASGSYVSGSSDRLEYVLEDSAEDYLSDEVRDEFSTHKNSSKEATAEQENGPLPQDALHLVEMSDNRLLIVESSGNSSSESEHESSNYVEPVPESARDMQSQHSKDISDGASGNDNSRAMGGSPPDNPDDGELEDVELGTKGRGAFEDKPLQRAADDEQDSSLRLCLILACCCGLLIGAAIALGAYFLFFDDDDERSSPQILAVETESPTDLPTIFPITTTQPPSPAPMIDVTDPPVIIPIVTDPPTSSPTINIEDAEKIRLLIEFIATAFPAGEAALEDETSPQFQALLWIFNRIPNNAGIWSDRRYLQRYALTTLYYSTGGPAWGDSSDWLTNTTECEWYSSSTSATLCDANDNLLELDLTGNDLSGTIPIELAMLSDNLQILRLTGNRLVGTIPAILLESNLNLVELRLDDNELSGTIPTQIGDLTDLEILDLSSNAFEGPLPSQVGSLISLARLALTENEIVGTIPPELSNLINAESFFLDKNRFTPSLPSELCSNLGNLVDFWSDCNAIGGCECCTVCCTDDGECVPT